MKQIRKWKIIFHLIPLCLLCLLFVRTKQHTEPVLAATTRTALDGIYIENVPVGGMTEEQIQQVIDTKIAEFSSVVLNLSFAGNVSQFSAYETGLTWTNTQIVREIMLTGTTGNVLQRFRSRNKVRQDENIYYNLEFAFDEEAVRNVINTYAVPYNTDPVDYKLVVTSDGPSVSGGYDGYYVNQDGAAATILDFMGNSWHGGSDTIELPYDTVNPKGDAATLSRMKDVLGKCETDWTGSTDARITNLKNGVSKINGSIIQPGETFSVTQHVVPFTLENGYAWGTAYELGGVIDSIGGGICQVSSTLYGAVLAAELDVYERFEHSMVVGYVLPSMDAAISEGAKDFIFTNTTNAPIYIYGYSYDTKIGFIIYGEETRPANRKVSYESKVLTEEEATIQVFEDSEMKFGQTRTDGGHKGQTAELYKVVTVDGVEQSRKKINESVYTMSPHKVYVGTQDGSPEGKAALRAAIATSDLNNVNAVINQYGVVQ